ncbi:hypothetical protein [Streptomyces sp. NPDC051219]|uniref:hypothetical protein n=1 Tax=Streptomyces sp. NPDC051219 TaxID=3155283 RepID=UPI00342280E4
MQHRPPALGCRRAWPSDRLPGPVGLPRQYIVRTPGAPRPRGASQRHGSRRRRSTARAADWTTVVLDLDGVTTKAAFMDCCALALLAVLLA